MMRKAKKLYMTLALAGSALLASCDSYLDIQPVGQVIPNSLDEYRALMTTAYNFSVNDRWLCEMRADGVVIRDDEHDRNSYEDIAIWNDNGQSATTAEFGWANYYAAIYYANAVIDKQDEIADGSEADINQLVGEAYFMRAYLHFLLVNLYGEPYTKSGAPESKSVPLKWNVDLEEVPVRTTVERVYEGVLSDIESARRLLQVEEWESAYKYRFSTLSVDALESRVRLYRGEWQAAYEAAERVLARKAGLEDFNSEGSLLPNSYQSVEMITAYEQMGSSSMVPASRATEDLTRKYDADSDLRFVRYFGTPDGNGLCTILKTDGSTSYRCSFRTGELYLNAAEAAARQGQDMLKEARERLLQLMEKRYTPEGYARKAALVAAMDQEALVEEILAERARELAFEGHRWFDLRRTTRPAIEKVVDGTTYTLQQDDARYTLRIPLAATEANPGLLN